MLKPPTSTDREPQDITDVLAAEFDALRPSGGYADCTDLKEVLEIAHGEQQGMTALCISGGGMRSASFGLGAIQQFARCGLLKKFDYLSTVAGGGYIGSWLTAWSQRAGGVDQLIESLTPDAKPIPAGLPDPIEHLRAHNSFMSLKQGTLSAQTWTRISILLRNVVLNGMVLLPVLMALLLVPRILVSVLALPELLFGDLIFAQGADRLNFRIPELNSIGDSWLVSVMLPTNFILLFAVALFNTLRYMPGFGAKAHTRRDYQQMIMVPLIGAVFTFLVFDSLYYVGDNCAPSTDYWAGDNCSGPASLFNYVAVTLLPSLIAWAAYAWWVERPATSRHPLLAVVTTVLSTAIGVGVAIWVVVNFLLPYLDWAQYVTLGPPAILIGFVVGINIFIGVSARFLGPPTRQWIARCVGDILMYCVAWIVLCSTVLIVPGWVLQWREWAIPLLGLLVTFSAWGCIYGNRLPDNLFVRGSPLARAVSMAASFAINMSPGIFIVSLAIGLSIITNILLTWAYLLPGMGKLPPGWLFMKVQGVDNPQVYGVYHAWIHWSDHLGVLTRSSPGLLLAFLGALLPPSMFLARYVDINSFSLHSIYRDRLVRLFLGASNPRREENQITGFASDDDIAMGDIDPCAKPLHVLNMTVNPVGSIQLGSQQRRAHSFTVSALYSGNFSLGYRPTARYGGADGLTLGTALTLSGAAANPNLGFRRSPAATLIMTLLSSRLGSWLGNPGPLGARTWRDSGPGGAVRTLFEHIFGRTAKENEYIYLSDGAHFESLGLYEMVLRRCRRIIVLDSNCDPAFAFADLANALRKIRIDFNIPITFEDDAFNQLREHRTRCVVGTIHYSLVDDRAPDGQLIVVKPMLRGTEQPELAHHGIAYPQFPHEDIRDARFYEAQFESYRLLGISSIAEICGDWRGDTMAEFFRHVEDDYVIFGGANTGKQSAQTDP